ncbi:uncharacterized protein LOC141900423 isoform X1 [Tubulanus polymorphus]|uniref:uncharacterized protein LOC141900423 isoform X1 n=1 Tax=Tubulanus polymorphus TaxID=672921 RepID=UPI003DA1D5A8
MSSSMPEGQRWQSAYNSIATSVRDLLSTEPACRDSSGINDDVEIGPPPDRGEPRRSLEQSQMGPNQPYGDRVRGVFDNDAIYNRLGPAFMQNNRQQRNTLSYAPAAWPLNIEQQRQTIEAMNSALHVQLSTGEQRRAAASGAVPHLGRWDNSTSDQSARQYMHANDHHNMQQDRTGPRDNNNSSGGSRPPPTTQHQNSGTQTSQTDINSSSANTDAINADSLFYLFNFRNPAQNMNLNFSSVNRGGGGGANFAHAPFGFATGNRHDRDSLLHGPDVTVFPMRSLPYFFHYLQNKFYFETYLWLHQNVMFHPRSEQTRQRMHMIGRAWNVSHHDVAMATLSVHMMKYANLRQRTMTNVQGLLHEVSQGNTSADMLRNLRSLAVDVCIHLNPRQMLRDYCKLIREIKQAVCGNRTSPGTRRRPRERNPARHTDSPERRAFQPPHVPPPRHVHPANIPQQHGHPLMMDMEQMQATAPVTVPPYAIPVCSAPHHIPVCTTTHLPGCHTSQPAWSIPACGMHIPTHCGMQHLPNCNLASIPMTHSIPPMIHHPPPHPAMTHHHHMTMPSPLLHSPSTLQHQDDDVQIIAEHRAPHTIQMPNTLHHGPTLAHHTAPVILHEPPLHAPPHELYGPYPRYTRRPAGRSRWRSIPPPPPPYPGFLLHFLAMLGNPPVPGSYGMDLRDEGREVENYEALLNLAERLGEAKPRGLTKSDIDQLPSYRFNVDTHRNDADQTCCVVCMCDFEARQLLRVLPCSHEFHAKCVDKWLKTNRTCPICRADASEVSSSPQPQ